MKLKLTYVQFKSLYEVLAGIVKSAKPVGMQTKMLHSVLMDVYEKMYKKDFAKKKTYSITLKTHEAVAFWMFFQRYQLPAEMVFEQNLVFTISNSIHQKFSV